MKDIISKFKITDGKKFSLKDHDTSFSGDYKKKTQTNCWLI